MKKKRHWKIIIFVSAFSEKKKEKNLEQKVPCWGQRSRGKFAFSKEDHFLGIFFPAKETITYSNDIKVKMKQK